jgi:membrane associated rhomboid family serine protease
MSISLLIVIVTCVTSFYAFSNPALFEQLKFNPYAVWHQKQWYRIFSLSLLHADMTHLIFNMLALYSFGPAVEEGFVQVYGTRGLGIYVVFYLLAIGAANIFDLFKYKDDYNYSGVGASGGISAVMFAFILFYPDVTGFSVFFIPLGKTPAWVVGLAFLVLSTFLANRQMSRVNHIAHFWGAVFGFIFPIIGNWWLLERFIHKILP